MEPGWMTFAIGGLAALLITFSTVSDHTIRAAGANPADALREE